MSKPINMESLIRNCMQGENELSKLYRILDTDGKNEVEIEDKYMESVKRRLKRVALPEPSSEISQESPSPQPRVNLPKPRFRIIQPRKITRKKEPEKKRSVDDVFEIERISREELIAILERERTKEQTEEQSEEKPSPPPAPEMSEITEDVKETALSKESFVKAISKVKGIGEKRAELLYESGFDTFEKIVSAKPREISRKVKGISTELARKLKKDIKKMMQTHSLEEEIPEWETVEKNEPYRYEDYTLYMVEKRGKIKYVFSKKPPRKGKPCQIPDGYVIKINRKGVPSLEKVK
ncbi:MAG: hypothetical protein FE042_04845 [Thermoplasmata archaeon]|nr:MAG: hypothetical protein FE042_04845 [Thermoplasmata archaeon]